MKSFHTVLFVLSTLSLAALAGCGSDSLRELSGSLKARVLNPPASDTKALVHVFAPDGRRDLESPLAEPETTVTAAMLPVGKVDVHLVTFDPSGTETESRWQRNLVIQDDVTTEAVFDLSQPPPPDCVTLSCTGSEVFSLFGANDGLSLTTCTAATVGAASEECCDGETPCAERQALLCVPTETELVSVGLCKTIADCASGSPTTANLPDGTPCGATSVCQGGVCVPDLPDPPPDVGCADGTREGYLDLGTYPGIAGCSGGWSEGGLSTATLVPHCARANGNTSANVEGNGCGAEDLCAAGWHVCHGKTEVQAKSPDGCGGAVPTGARDKSLFFAVLQHSVNNSVCDDSAGDNDVFGCGNLGHVLTADKSCGPLNRALASTQAQSCGYNEAEPPLGPWVCVGDATSHLHEGGLVKKNGCPGGSCSYDGAGLGSQDKGGVLCCED